MSLAHSHAHSPLTHSRAHTLTLLSDQVCRVLLDAGADLDVRDALGETAEDVASRCSYAQVLLSISPSQTVISRVVEVERVVERENPRESAREREREIERDRERERA